MKNIIALLIITFSLTACSLKDETITDVEETISITKPSLWFKIDSLNVDAIIKIGNPVYEAYFIVISEPKADFPDGYTLTQYSALTRGIIKERSEGFSEHQDDSLTAINGMTATKYIIDTTVENIKLRYWHVSVSSQDKFYQLVSWSSSSRFDSNKESFMSVLESFREKKTKNNGTDSIERR